MNKLMHANWMRLKKDRVFWVCMAAMFVIGAAIGLLTGGSEPESFSIDRTFFVYTIPLEFACAVFCSLFTGADYSDGTIRNKIAVGHSRVSVYLSNLLICAIAGMGFGCAYIFSMLAIGIPRLGGFEMGVTSACMLIGITIFMMLATCAIFTLISMLCQSRAVVAVVCLLAMIVMLFAGAWLNARLHEPEFYDSYVYTDHFGSIAEAPKERNPNYLSGTARTVFQFFMELLPAGQALLFTNMELVHTWQLPLYSLIVIMLTTAIGLLVFGKKDLR